MAADSRYLYQPAHQAINPPQYTYQYQNPPPPAAYEPSSAQHAPPPPPPPLRNMRASQQSPHSPQAQYPPQHSPPIQSTGYAPVHPSYNSQGHYIAHAQPAPPSSASSQHTPPPPPQSQSQWSNENWQPQYSHYPSHVPQQHQQQHQQHPSPLPLTVAPENTYNNHARPDTSPALSTSSLRGYDDRVPPVHEHHQPPPPPQSSINGAPMAKYRQREEQSPTSYTNSQPASPNMFASLDYDQLMKQIKFVESPIRETLSTFRSPHPDTLEQMMQAATYAAQVLTSAAGISPISASHPTPVTYQQPNTIPPAPGYTNHRLSPPTIRDRMESHPQGSHTHTLSNDNSPPLSASTTGSLKRRHTNEYPENSQQSPLVGGSSAGGTANPNLGINHGSNSASAPVPAPPQGSMAQQQQQQQQHQSGSGPGQQPPSYAQSQLSSQSHTGGGPMAPSNPPSGGAPPTEGQTCLGCNATSTPEWRRGPMGMCVVILVSSFGFWFLPFSFYSIHSLGS
ncbi:hypothetical protein F5878DRAFT_381252 [Lentinula raphanica]|uniref:GATA-type domain-containing protein n=1 Tax=Lentinula raphanica TaxID=153919 RepID=A0AA38P0R2_9AGAR|nr:hypothetical protein F5878DRAFT_381252 [Lentinula raphanica]